MQKSLYIVVDGDVEKGSCEKVESIFETQAAIKQTVTNMHLIARSSFDCFDEEGIRKNALCLKEAWNFFELYSETNKSDCLRSDRMESVLITF